MNEAVVFIKPSLLCSSDSMTSVVSASNLSVSVADAIVTNLYNTSC